MTKRRLGRLLDTPVRLPFSTFLGALLLYIDEALIRFEIPPAVHGVLLLTAMCLIVRRPR